MLCRLVRFYGGSFEEWSRRPIDIAGDALANLNHLRADEAVIAMSIAHAGENAERTMESFREAANYVADDEPEEDRSERLRAQEAKLLLDLGDSLGPRR